MKARTLKIVTLAASLALAMSMLTGCLGGGDKVFTDGNFQYIVIKRTNTITSEVEKFVAIVDYFGSSDVIDFPLEINGIPVRYIGYRRGGFGYAPRYYNFTCNYVKKMYIHENIEDIYEQAFDNCFGYGALVNIVVCHAQNVGNVLSNCCRIVHSPSYIYIAKAVYDSRDSDWNKVIYWANTAFMNNYSSEINGGYYSLDNIEKGELIRVPTNPERDGYEFTGWYTEEKCINKWDFNSSPTIEEDTEFRLYAGWREI